MTSVHFIDYTRLPRQLKRQLRDSLTRPQYIVHQHTMSALRSYVGNALWVGLFTLFALLLLTIGLAMHSTKTACKAGNLLLGIVCWALWWCMRLVPSFIVLR